jgi:hypothetical protein
LEGGCDGGGTTVPFVVAVDDGDGGIHGDIICYFVVEGRHFGQTKQKMEWFLNAS